MRDVLLLEPPTSGCAGTNGLACNPLPRPDQHLQQCDQRVPEHRGHDSHLFLDVGSVNQLARSDLHGNIVSIVHFSQLAYSSCSEL